MEEPEFDATQLQIGQAARFSPYDGLTDDQADKLQAELEERDRRKLPLGFRRCTDTGAGGWPQIPRFDIRDEDDG